MKKASTTFSLLMLISAFLLPIFLFAQSQNLTPTQERELLENQLKELESQIGAIEGDITKTQKEKDTLKNQIAVLRSKIQKLNLQIEQSTILIGDLRSQIQDTSASIEKTSAEIEKIKDQMGEVLRQVYQGNQKSKLEIVLGGETLSDFFGNLAALETLNVRLEEMLANMKELNDYLNDQHNALETEKESEENFVKIQLLQKQENQNLQAQTQNLLTQTQGKEAEYQRQLADKKKQAQQIRSRIFELIGVPQAPTFGEAVEIAKAAAAQPGVRPALLLAVLTQE